MSRAFRVPVVALSALLLPQLALAHALLVRSNPQANAVVHGGSLAIDLKFNSRIDAPHCLLTLQAGSGPAEKLAIGSAPAPDELVAQATKLHPGSYQLLWQAVAVDGHITRGEIPFTVK